jgi:8-oxo-dGTP diphosphatase
MKKRGKVNKRIVKKKISKGKRILAKAIFIKKTGQGYLFCFEKRKAKETNYAGFWSFPQGHKEKGEKIENTLVREMREELNIKVTSFRKLGVFHDKDPTSKAHYEQHVFLCLEWAGEIKETQEQEMLAWLSLMDTKSLNLPDVDKRIILKLIED